jgi:hypothetical protein
MRFKTVQKGARRLHELALQHTERSCAAGCKRTRVCSRKAAMSLRVINLHQEKMSIMTHVCWTQILNNNKALAREVQSHSLLLVGQQMCDVRRKKVQLIMT